jgi:hypothetical protein
MRYDFEKITMDRLLSSIVGYFAFLNLKTFVRRIKNNFYSTTWDK